MWLIVQTLAISLERSTISVKNTRGSRFGSQMTLILSSLLEQFPIRVRIRTRPSWLPGKGQYLPVVGSRDWHTCGTPLTYRLGRRCSLSTEPLYNNTSKSLSASAIGSTLRFFVLDYRHIIISGFIIYLPEYLSSNQVETERIRAHLSVDDRKIYIPADLVCKLLWPSHVPHPSLADTTSDECDAKEIVSLLRVPLPVRFPGYTYDPRHMLCVTCLRGILRSKFWSWWEVHRKLPPVNAPDQPDCSYGLDCKRQRNAYHATLYNVSSSFDELYLPATIIDRTLLALVPRHSEYAVGATFSTCHYHFLSQFLCSMKTPIFMCQSERTRL